MYSPIYLSVVISTYNEGQYLKESINSILKQTYPYFELIIVNDGSTDNTSQLLSTFNDNRIRVINKVNTGLPNSLNIGIETAKFDWIARMDGDDIALPNRFEDQVKLIKKGYDIIGGQFYTIDEFGDCTESVISRNPISLLSSKMFVFLGWNPLAHPTAVFRKGLIKEFGGYDENFIASQDLELWLRVSHKAKIINCKEAVLKYRNHKGNISNSKKCIQQNFGFLAFVKNALMIRKPLTTEQFSKLICERYISSCLENNNRFLELIHHVKNGRTPVMLLYYLWRTCVFVKLRIWRHRFFKFT